MRFRMCPFFVPNHVSSRVFAIAIGNEFEGKSERGLVLQFDINRKQGQRASDEFKV